MCLLRLHHLLIGMLIQHDHQHNHLRRCLLLLRNMLLLLLVLSHVSYVSDCDVAAARLAAAASSRSSDLIYLNYAPA